MTNEEALNVTETTEIVEETEELVIEETIGEIGPDEEEIDEETADYEEINESEVE